MYSGFCVTRKITDRILVVDLVVQLLQRHDRPQMAQITHNIARCQLLGYDGSPQVRQACVTRPGRRASSLLVVSRLIGNTSVEQFGV